MKTSRFPVRHGPLLVLALSLLAGSLSGNSQTTLYSTGFEPEEGYDPDLTLIGQDDWVAFGAGGNGIVTNAFAGLGQQAFIGYSAPEGETNEFFSVYRPLNLPPLTPAQSVIKFSVLMQIVDSSPTNKHWDDFRWSVYNTNGLRLFSVDFDNSSLLISYALDDGAGFVSTNTKFDTQGGYDLVITMNLARNLWSATLNDQVIINAKPITTVGSPLNIGDVDAVWAMRDPGAPGDNYMLFDQYALTAEPAPSIAAHLETLGLPAGAVRLYGEPGLTYGIEASTDLQHWESLLTLVAPTGGVLEFRDPNASLFPRRFYRARQAR